jgi:hypothetical protein
VDTLVAAAYSRIEWHLEQILVGSGGGFAAEKKKTLEGLPPSKPLAWQATAPAQYDKRAAVC